MIEGFDLDDGPGFSLRGYQGGWMANTAQDRASGFTRLLLDAPGGTGKTSFFAALAKQEWQQRQGRTLILENRHQLVMQTVGRIQRETGMDVDIEMADHHASPYAPIVVASVASIGRVNRLTSFKDAHFSLVVPDECFPAGTTVDGKAIESIRIGDYVRSYNHKTGLIEQRKVLRLFKNPAKILVRVRAAGRVIVCTPDHPFYTEHGYIAAKDLRGRKCAVLENSRDELQALREDRRLPREEAFYDQPGSGDEREPPLFKGMFGCLEENSSASNSRQALGVESKEFISAHERAQPDEQSGCGCEDGSFSQGPHISFERGQRHTHEATDGALGSSGRLADGVCDTNRPSLRQVPVATAVLQGRYCGAGVEAGSRGGRIESPREEMEILGRQKNSGIEFSRVDGVEILEPGSRSGYSKVCPDGFVYNFEVEGNNNYFADGVLVHNCHHAMAPLFLRTMNYFHYGAASLEPEWVAPKDGTYAPKCAVVGTTATPDIHGKKNLGDFFQKFTARYSYLQAIEDGWLVGLKEVNIPVKIDTRKFRTKSGGYGKDFSAEDESAAIIPIIEELAEQIWKLAPHRKTMAFLPSLECAQLMAAALNRRGLKAIYVSGECLDKTEKTEEFERHGPGIVLCLCALYVEGTDFPDVDCVAWMRATLSPPFYKQGVYRCTRVLPGIVSDDMTAEERRAAIAASRKPYGLLISPFFVSDRVDICSIVDLFVSDPDLRDKVKKSPADLSTEKKIRDFIEALEKAADKHRNKQARTIDPVTFSLSIGADKIAAYNPGDGADFPASREELDLLLEFGLDTTKVKSSEQAQRLIATLRERDRLGLASPKALTQLTLRLGWPEDKASMMKAGQAGAIIGRGVRYRQTTTTATAQ